MSDEELSYWTSKGTDSAGLYVATIDDLVVGTAAYIVEVGYQNLNMNQLID